MDETQIFDRIHAALDVQPPPGALDRLETVIGKATIKPRPRPAITLQWPRTGRRLTAALLLVVMASVAVGVYLVAHRALNQSVPGRPHAPRATIVFGRVNANGDEYVYTIRADGTGEKELVATPSCCAVWSHQGDRLLLAASPAGGSSSSVTTAIVNADGSGYRVLPLDPSGLNLGGSAWSPDDSRIAFEGWDDSNPSLNGLYTADAADGGNRRRLTTINDVPLSYSPDGSRILFWRGPGSVSGHPAGQLFLVGINGGALTQVSPPGMTVWACCYFGAPGGWSPDGTRISFAAFSPTASDQGRSAVFVAAGNGTNAKQISDWGEYTISARWSPTANWIVFDKIDSRVGAHSFYLVHPDGSGIKTIPLLAAECCAVWSPEGDRLLFANGPSDLALNLWIVNIDGSHLVQVTHAPAKLTDIGWGAVT